MKNLKFEILLDFYNCFLTEKQIEVMEQYYSQDLSLSEISENLGITRQGVRDNIKRAESLLLEFEEKIGAVQRYNDTLKLIQDIGKEAHAIAKDAYQSGNYKIYEQAKRILEHLNVAREGIVEVES